MKYIKKLISILGGLLLTFGFVATVSAALPTDLVGWWRFENNGDDSSIYANNAAVTGAVTFDNTAPVIDNYYGVFNGVSEYLVAPDSVSLDLSATGGTLEAWVYPKSFPTVGI